MCGGQCGTSGLLGRNVLCAGELDWSSAMCGRFVQPGVAAISMPELHGGFILSVGFIGGIIMPSRYLQR